MEKEMLPRGTETTSAQRMHAIIDEMWEKYDAGKLSPAGQLILLTFLDMDQADPTWESRESVEVQREKMSKIRKERLERLNQRKKQSQQDNS